ncbi:hypothetical protein CI238_10550 [Colletotrichum incanum]|uniref:Uncharacterized protein n=1 Tax=Colletotrichum incanum TaxID=1573173 RepID=A0A167AVR6_COLIC|nr:hypothetical protein CI238_10550 [Colletotrichum incanum]
MAIKPANRYNIDKTGILKGKGSNGLVLGRAKTKSVRKKRLDHKPKYLLLTKGILLYPFIIYKVNYTYSASWIKVSPRNASYSERSKRLPRAVLSISYCPARNPAPPGLIDPNTKFATISNIRQSQIEAGEVRINTAESSASDCPSEAESCIVVASRAG